MPYYVDAEQSWHGAYSGLLSVTPVGHAHVMLVAS